MLRAARPGRDRSTSRCSPWCRSVPPPTAASCSDRRTGRIVQGITNDLAGNPLPEHLDLDRAADLGAIRRHVRVRDRTLDAEAIAAARDPAHDFAVDPDGLRTLCNRARI